MQFNELGLPVGFLSIRYVAEILATTVKKVEELADAGEISYIDLKGARSFATEDVASFIKRNRYLNPIDNIERRQRGVNGY
jgi:hypothetical protein